MFGVVVVFLLLIFFIIIAAAGGVGVMLLLGFNQAAFSTPRATTRRLPPVFAGVYDRHGLSPAAVPGGEVFEPLKPFGFGEVS